MNVKIEVHPTWKWIFCKDRGTEYWEMPHDWVVRIGPLWIMWGDKLWREDAGY
jgi:hypothetical protein